ncbi:uncharacterized protein LOC115401590 isoform X2 [Salarias fasciatus]|uniref:uncharacterized protein LOC115401590 isoform X2 n=1 Tax=Salarias fasciatus TaxID=181472 RepID=UPI001176506F|nr:uncharacterized protein LOC115401590 isoform X2 [Salarias fasciatus]
MRLLSLAWSFSPEETEDTAGHPCLLFPFLSTHSRLFISHHGSRQKGSSLAVLPPVPQAKPDPLNTSCQGLHEGQHPSRAAAGAGEGQRLHQALVKELQRRGFFILNAPMDVDLEEFEARSSEQPSATAGPVPPAAEQAGEGSPAHTSEEEGSGSDDPTWQQATPNFSTSVRVRMQEENLYAKFPPETTELKKFKNHLVSVLETPNYQQEVDNVSRVLRYLQPTGDQVSLDFLDSTAPVGDFFAALKRVGQTAATRFNYIKSLVKFIRYLQLEHGGTDPAFFHKCTNFMDFLSVLRKSISETHSKDRKRHEYFVGAKTGVHECQKVLRVAKKDALGVYERLLRSEPVSEEEKTRYKYYCEAVLLLGHFQRPGAVEGLTVTEWLAKQDCGGRVVVAVKSHKTANRPLALFALTQEEAALIQQYFLCVRPDYIKAEADDEDEDEDEAHHRLFLSTNGKPVRSATTDLQRLHQHYELPSVSSQEVRRAVETAANSTFSDEQKTGLAYYLARMDKAPNEHHHTWEPGRIVETANLVRLLTNGSDDSDHQPQAGSRRGREASHEDYNKFQELFPVTLDGQPPNKVQRTSAGFSADWVLYDKSRAVQDERAASPHKVVQTAPDSAEH